MLSPSPATGGIYLSLSLRYGNGRLSDGYLACPYSVTSAVHSLSGAFIHVSSTSIESQAGLDGMTLWLSFGSYELGLVLPLRVR